MEAFAKLDHRLDQCLWLDGFNGDRWSSRKPSHCWNYPTLPPDLCVEDMARVSPLLGVYFHYDADQRFWQFSAAVYKSGQYYSYVSVELPERLSRMILAACEPFTNSGTGCYYLVNLWFRHPLDYSLSLLIAKLQLCGVRLRRVYEPDWMARWACMATWPTARCTGAYGI